MQGSEGRLYTHSGEEAVEEEDGGQREVSPVQSQHDAWQEGQVAQRQQVDGRQLLALRQTVRVVTARQAPVAYRQHKLC